MYSIGRLDISMSSEVEGRTIDRWCISSTNIIAANKKMVRRHILEQRPHDDEHKAARELLPLPPL